MKVLSQVYFKKRDRKYILHVRRQIPPPLGGGLCQGSTSTHCTSQGAMLWLRRSTHWGQLTTAPSWPNLVGLGAFAS